MCLSCSKNDALISQKREITQLTWSRKERLLIDRVAYLSVKTFPSFFSNLTKSIAVHSGEIQVFKARLLGRTRTHKVQWWTQHSMET